MEVIPMKDKFNFDKLDFLRHKPDNEGIHTPAVHSVIDEDGRTFAHEDHENFDGEERAFLVDPGKQVTIKTVEDDGEVGALTITWDNLHDIVYHYPTMEGEE